MRCTGIVWNKAWVVSVWSVRRSRTRAMTQRLGGDESIAVARRAGLHRHHRRARLYLGGIRGPVSLPGRLGKSVWRFCQRSSVLDADYAPQTVNTDGWQALKRWKALFTHMTIILCFLHAFSNSDRATKTVGEAFAQVQTRCGGVSRPEQTGLFPASATLEAGRDALPDGMMKSIPWTCARNAISSVRAMTIQGASHQQYGGPADEFWDRAFFHAQYCPWHARFG